MNEKRMRKLQRVLGTYTAAALTVLALMATVYGTHLEDFRTAARYSYELSFEESAAAVNALSDTLGKARYATGELCRSLASEAFAEACAAKAALGTLPFSTVEMEQTKSFLGTAGGFARQLCDSGGEFDDAERADLSALADTAEAYAAALTQMRLSLANGELEMDSREVRLRNVADGKRTRLLSESFAEAEENFPLTAELLSYQIEKADTQSRYADVKSAAAAAGRLLGVSPELLREECRYADGSVGLSRDSLYIHASADGVLSLSDSRLVETGTVSEKRAAEKAREFLRLAGYGDMQESGRRRAGNVLYVNFLGRVGEAVCLDCSAEVGIALDNCSLYAFRAPEGIANGSYDWPLSESDAQAALPSSLVPLGSRRVVYEGQPCYEFRCRDGERSVTILVDARYARQLSITVE